MHTYVNSKFAKIETVGVLATSYLELPWAWWECS
jgi:hypothetical protein